MTSFGVRMAVHRLVFWLDPHLIDQDRKVWKESWLDWPPCLKCTFFKNKSWDIHRNVYFCLSHHVCSSWFCWFSSYFFSNTWSKFFPRFFFQDFWSKRNTCYMVTSFLFSAKYFFVLKCFQCFYFLPMGQFEVIPWGFFGDIRWMTILHCPSIIHYYECWIESK